jgi:hypothetical protein
LDCLVGSTNQTKGSSTGWQPNLYSRGLFGWLAGWLVGWWGSGGGGGG